MAIDLMLIASVGFGILVIGIVLFIIYRIFKSWVKKSEEKNREFREVVILKKRGAFILKPSVIRMELIRLTSNLRVLKGKTSNGKPFYTTISKASPDGCYWKIEMEDGSLRDVDATIQDISSLQIKISSSASQTMAKQLDRDMKLQYGQQEKSWFEKYGLYLGIVLGIILFGVMLYFVLDKFADKLIPALTDLADSNRLRSGASVISQ